MPPGPYKQGSVKRASGFHDWGEGKQMQCLLRSILHRGNSERTHRFAVRLWDVTRWKAENFYFSDCTYRDPVRESISSRFEQVSVWGTKTMTAIEIREALEKFYPDVTDLEFSIKHSGFAHEHPLTAIGVLLISSIVLKTTDPAKLAQFTGYSERFVRPARSPSRLATLYTRGSDGFVSSTAALIASGWSEPVPGRTCTRSRPAPFHGAREIEIFQQLLNRFLVIDMDRDCSEQTRQA